MRVCVHACVCAAPVGRGRWRSAARGSAVPGRLFPTLPITANKYNNLTAMYAIVGIIKTNCQYSQYNRRVHRYTCVRPAVNGKNRTVYSTAQRSRPAHLCVCAILCICVWVFVLCFCWCLCVCMCVCIVFVCVLVHVRVLRPPLPAPLAAS